MTLMILPVDRPSTTNSCQAHYNAHRKKKYGVDIRVRKQKDENVHQQINLAVADLHIIYGSRYTKTRARWSLPSIRVHFRLEKAGITSN